VLREHLFFFSHGSRLQAFFTRFTTIAAAKNIGTSSANSWHSRVAVNLDESMVSNMEPWERFFCHKDFRKSGTDIPHGQGYFPEHRFER
jgi:hypothetical protein